MLYFSGEFNKQDESDFSILFKSLIFSILFKSLITIIFLLSLPVIIIYRLMFGKIKIDTEDPMSYDLYGFIVLSVWLIFSFLTLDVLEQYITPGNILEQYISYITPDDFIKPGDLLFTISILIGIFITRFFKKWIFSKKQIN